MRRTLICIAVGTFTLAVLSQTGGKWAASMTHSVVGGRKYACRIDRETIIGGPTWDSSKPLPLSLAEAERLARAELAKLTEDVSGWEVTKFELNRAPWSANWYYAVELHPVGAALTNRQYFSIFLDANGRAGNFYEE